MERFTILLAAVFLGLVLAGCGGGEEAREDAKKDEGQPKSVGDEIVVGGFEVEGPEGREIEIPEVAVEREAVEVYLGEVRPVVEVAAQDLSGVVSPSARVENQALILTIEVESIEQARQATQQGLGRLREIEPPEDLRPVHERLIEAYEGALPAYDDIIEAFNGGDVGALTETVQESLPEIEQSIAEARTILQELQRAQSQEAVRRAG